jgi:nicotinate phosphoribosyltransferase
MLDEAGLSHLKVFASGGLDEREIDRLLRSGAPIDAFGVGTDMSVSGDAPALDIAYKLTEYAGTGRMKLSTGKRTLPGRKQIFREIRDGRAVCDVIGRFDEALLGRPLLAPVMRKGRRLPPPQPTLAAIRAYAKDALGELPDDVQALAPVEHPFEVTISPTLAEDERRLREQLMRAFSSTAAGSS